MNPSGAVVFGSAEIPQGRIVVDKPAYRAATMRPGGWANANLRTQFLKILRRAGVSPWERLFHSMRASRQTELERQFPRHVVCAWLGNAAPQLLASYSHQTEHLIVEGLRADSAMTVSLVAELDGTVVGQIAFSPVMIDGKDFRATKRAT